MRTQIKCPNCGTLTDVQDILVHQLEEEIKQKFQFQLAVEKKKYETEFEGLNKAKDEFEQKKKQDNEIFQEQLKKQLKEEKKTIEAESQKKLNETLLSEREKIKKTEEDRNELRFKELQKQLEDQKKLTEEMKRKQEQGSMQRIWKQRDKQIEKVVSNTIDMYGSIKGGYSKQSKGAGSFYSLK